MKKNLQSEVHPRVAAFNKRLAESRPRVQVKKSGGTSGQATENLSAPIVRSKSAIVSDTEQPPRGRSKGPRPRAFRRLYGWATRHLTPKPVYL